MKPRVWGGDRLVKEFGRKSVDQPIGESWEVHGDLIVSGTSGTLNQLIEQYGAELMGRKVDTSHGFPLLTKWLDCRSWLSVQVHPDDALAREFTQDPTARGKTEAWYIHRTTADAELIHGLAPGVNYDQLEGIRGPDILEFLDRQHPRAGQLLHTPAGQIHALGPGNLLYEVQQSCDLTYRFFDWGRGRPLHVERALDCARRSKPGNGTVSLSKLSCNYFEIDLLTEAKKWELQGDSLQILVATQSGSMLTWKSGSMDLVQGQSVLLPANLGEIAIDGDINESILQIGIL